jgi:hypothetical protein
MFELLAPLPKFQNALRKFKNEKQKKIGGCLGRLVCGWLNGGSMYCVPLSFGISSALFGISSM